MLILKRKVDEGFKIWDDETGEVLIELVVTRIKGKYASIGINARNKYQIDREDLNDNDTGRSTRSDEEAKFNRVYKRSRK